MRYVVELNLETHTNEESKYQEQIMMLTTNYAHQIESITNKA